MIRRPPRSTLFPYTSSSDLRRWCTFGTTRRAIRRSPRTITRSGTARWSGSTTGSSRSEEHTSELQSLAYLVCRLLLEKKKTENDCTNQYHTVQKTLHTLHTH